jgi:FlaG/FlaF family flagellin (archaellin)
LFTPPYKPVMTDELVEATPRVVTVKAFSVAPAGTVVLAGTVATAVFELVRVTTAPPVGAGPLSIASPIVGLPPTTLAGERAIEYMSTVGVTVRTAVLLTPL